jgi:hypothetical protein
MSVATPKAAAKEPILFDIVLVCRKDEYRKKPRSEALDAAHAQMERLKAAGFTMSRNDRRVVLFGQLLAATTSLHDAEAIPATVETALAEIDAETELLLRKR